MEDQHIAEDEQASIEEETRPVPTITEIPECPVFHPSMEEFKDFEQYLIKCEASIPSSCGIFKVSFLATTSAFAGEQVH